MRYPQFLKNGGVIGFVAPSFGCNMDPHKSKFDHARELFKERGYGEKLGPNCYLGEGIGISSTPEKCAEELMEAYLDPESDILIACAGGELMCEVISRMDFRTIREARPKWYLGYSDNTNMIFLLATLCDVAAVYGPNGASFGLEPWHTSMEDTLGILKGSLKEVHGYEKWEREGLAGEENPLAPWNLQEERVLRLWVPWERSAEANAETAGSFDAFESGGAGDVSQSVKREVYSLAEGGGRNFESDREEDIRESGRLIEDARRFHGSLRMRGRMIGGCMDCLVNLTGTRFDKVWEFQERYAEDGFLWFLESCDLNVFAIRRAMWQMEEAGWFRYVKGFLIGRPLCYGQEMMGLDAYEAVLAVARKYRVPVVMDADLGHLPPAMPIVSGSIGTVEVIGNDIRIEYEYR